MKKAMKAWLKQRSKSHHRAAKGRRRKSKSPSKSRSRSSQESPARGVVSTDPEQKLSVRDRLVATMKKAAALTGTKMRSTAAPAPRFLPYGEEEARASTPPKALPPNELATQWFARAWHKIVAKAPLAKSTNDAIFHRVRPSHEFHKQGVPIKKHIRTDFRWPDRFVSASWDDFPSHVRFSQAEFKNLFTRWRDIAMCISAQAYPLEKLASLVEGSTDELLKPVLKSYIELQKDVLASSSKVTADGLITAILMGREMLLQGKAGTVASDHVTQSRLKSASFSDGIRLYDLRGEQTAWRRKTAHKAHQQSSRVASQLFNQNRGGGNSSKGQTKDVRPQSTAAPATPKQTFTNRGRVRVVSRNESVLPASRSQRARA